MSVIFNQFTRLLNAKENKINTDYLPTEYILINISNEAHCVHCEIQIYVDAS